MVDLESLSIEALKKSVKLCMQVVKPGKQVTFNFSRPGTVWLRAFSSDGRTECAIEFDNENFGHCAFNTSAILPTSSYALKIDEFSAAVANFDSVNLVNISAFNGSFVLTVNSPADEMKTFEVKVDRLEFYIIPPNEPLVKIGLSTRIFKTMLDYLDNFYADNVTITVTAEEATFAIRDHKCIISRERNEYILDGVPLEFPYVAQFSWQHLISAPIKRAIRMAGDRIWIYPSGPDDAPPALMCPEPSIGKITFYFLKEE